jgi:DNA polymerase/3'-5' exonuclease PolX
MSHEEVAAVFRRLADLMELRDDNPFKLRAYCNAAEVIEDLNTPLAEIVEVGGAVALRDLPGIGAAIFHSACSIICREPRDVSLFPARNGAGRIENEAGGVISL